MGGVARNRRDGESLSEKRRGGDCRWGDAPARHRSWTETLIEAGLIRSRTAASASSQVSVQTDAMSISLVPVKRPVSEQRPHLHDVMAGGSARTQTNRHQRLLQSRWIFKRHRAPQHRHLPRGVRGG